MVGERPRVWWSWWAVWQTPQGLFLEGSATCSRQLVSRRERLSSPTTQATAYGTNVAAVGIVAIDGGDQPSPGGLAQVLGGGPAAVPVALGQPVSQDQIGKDDPLPKGSVSAGGVLPQPGIPRLGDRPVARPDLDDLIG